MPKQQETIDRFRIIAEAAASEMGPIIAQLSRMGLTNISFELITDVVNFKQNVKHDVTATDFLAGWIAEHPTFSQKDVSKMFKENNRTSGAAYYAMRQLSEARVIRKLDDNGNYSRADVKHIEAPKEKAAKPAKEQKPEPKRVMHAVDHREFILRYMRSHGGRTSAAKLRDYFSKHNRKTTSIGGALNWLVQQKSVKLLGDGEYLLLAKGGAKSAPAPAKPKPNGNSNSNHVETPAAQTEVNNG
jgi:Fe2+ or Zn2+ uptake regulation protein